VSPGGYADQQWAVIMGRGVRVRGAAVYMNTNANVRMVKDEALNANTREG
jgi:hypothetical protein